MTARQIFDGVLIELNKVKAPSLLLEDFNYLFNKAINQYINKCYNNYDINQQTTDDIRVLKSTAILTPKITDAYTDHMADTNLGIYHKSIANLYGATYEITLPNDYLHMLNCICVYRVNKPIKCYDAGSYVLFGATKLDSDKWSQIINDYYNRPTPQRPYYFIHNVNLKSNESKMSSTISNEYTNPFNSSTGKGTDQYVMPKKDTTLEYWVTSSGHKVCVDKKYVGEYEIKGAIARFEDPDVNAYVGSLVDTNSAEFKVMPADPYIDLYETQYKQSEGKYPPVPNFLRGKMLLVTNNGFANGALTINSITKNIETHPFEKPGNDLFELPNAIYLDYMDSQHTFDRADIYKEKDGNFAISLDLVEKPAGSRHSNQSEIRCEIRYGKDNSVFELVEVMVDYLKSPQFIRLTPELMDLTEDTSQVMEFPDYVCQEIINELVHLVMENTSDPRIQTHPIVTLSIGTQAQQLAQPAGASATA